MSFVDKLLDNAASRYLWRRGAQHAKSGAPPIAVFAFDHIGHEINLRGRYEADQLECAIGFLRGSSLLAGDVVDVGANIGNHALFFAEHYDRVIAIEPNPRVFELLAFNAKLRGNIRPLNIGASDVNDELLLAFETDNWGGGRLASSRGELNRANNVPVKVRRLDDLSELDSRPVGLLKIDVEGHELRVLKGAAAMIKRAKPVVLFEQHSDEIAHGSSEVLDWLRANGYDQFYEVRSFPALPRSWSFPGRRAIDALMRLVMGETQRVVPITRLENAFYPMVIALPTR